MLRTMCVDLSNNLMAFSGCHVKKKRKKLYNPDDYGIYLKKDASTIESPCKNKMILIDNSETQFVNSSNCEQIAESVESEQLGESASDVQQARKKHKKSNKKKNKEPISIEENNVIDISNRKFNFDAQKLEDLHKKPVNNMDEAYICTEENNFTETPNEKKQFAESFLDVKQAKKKHKKSVKNKNNVLIFTDENNVEVNEENNFETSFSNVQKEKEKLKEFKTCIDVETYFSEKNNSIEVNKPQFIDESVFNAQKTKKKHKKSKKNMDMEPIFLEDSNGAKEFPSESFSSTLEIKKKHKNSNKNKVEEPFSTEVQNFVSNGEIHSVDTFCDTQQGEKKIKDKEKATMDENNVERIANEENQSVHSFCSVKNKKKKHKKSKINKDEEPTFMGERNTDEIGSQLRNQTFGENQSVEGFCGVQRNEKRHKKSKQNKDKVLNITDENNVEIANEQDLSAHSVWDEKTLNKKHKKSKKNKDKEPTIMEERSIVENENQLRNPPFEENQSVDTFSDVQQAKKKHKKSKKNKDKEPTIMEERNIVEIENQLRNPPFEENQSVDTFSDVQQAKKKHKKSKKNKDKEPTIMEERNIVEIENQLRNPPFEENQSVDTFSDVQQAKKKHKKSKKNKNEKQKNTEENNIVNIANEQNQSVDSFCNRQQMKKKHKSESNMNKETLTESSIEIPSVNSDFGVSFYDLKQLKKKSKKFKDKESAFSVENSIADSLNEERQFRDSFCNVQQLKKKHQKCENNTSEEPSLSEENNVFEISSETNNDILLEKSSLGTPMIENTHGRNNLKATDRLSGLNMIKQLQKISEISDIVEINSDDDSQNSNNNANVHSVDESLQQTHPFHLDSYEEPLDFDIPPLHAFGTVHSLTESQKNELISRGVTIKTGRFTREEDKILLKNFENFAKTHRTVDICAIFGIGNAVSSTEIKQFLKATHFYVRLGKGLKDRTLSSIYKRARLLLNPYKNNGKLSQAEVENIKHLRTGLRKKWTYIGENFEQPADKCLQAFRWNEKSISRGVWTAEEEKELIAAMEKVTGSSDLSYDKVKKISWERVAAHVPSRNSTQCRMHWAHHLGWKAGVKRAKWDKTCSKKLVEILRKDWYVEDASKIDWFKVNESFKNVSPSPVYVQKRWLYLKSKINDFKKKDYKTILDGLCILYQVSVNETFSAPFSSSAINQRLTHSIANMRKSLENR